MFVQRDQWVTPIGHLVKNDHNEQCQISFLQWEKKNRRHKTMPQHRWILIMCGAGLGSECFQIRLFPRCAAKKTKKKIIKHFDTFMCLLGFLTDCSSRHWTCRHVLFKQTTLWTNIHNKRAKGRELTHGPSENEWTSNSFQNTSAI